MKKFVIIILTMMLPMTVLAREYTLSLWHSNDTVKCRIVGAVNKNLYYNTSNEELVVVPYNKIRYIFLGETDVTNEVLSKDSIPIHADVYSLFPELSSPTVEIRQKSEPQIHRDYLRELSLLRESNQMIAGVLSAAVAVSIIGFIAVSRR